MHTRKFQLGVIGLGSHFNKNIYPNLINNDLFDIAGAFSPSKKKLKEYKGIKIYKSLNLILKNKDIKYFYVANITSLHYKICKQILKNKKNVICEKPITLNAVEFKKLKYLASLNNVIIFEAFMFKYHNNYRILSNIYKNKLSEIKSINIKFNIPSLNSDNFRYDKNKGGGSYADLACYTIKLFSLLVNSEVKKIYGIKVYNYRLVDISGNAMIVLKNNIVCNLEWGFDKFYENSITINTSKGLLTAHKVFSKKINEITKIEIKKNNSAKTIDIQADNHFFNMFKYFFSLSSNKKKYQDYMNELTTYQNMYHKINKTLLKCIKKL